MTEQEKKAYQDGQRSVWIGTLNLCLRNLGVDSPEVDAAKWIAEREEVISVLRSICGNHGDNDWDQEMHIADIINKHLRPYMEQKR